MSAPTILFLHGGGLGPWMWQPVIEELGDRFRCIVPDLPGHGRARDRLFSFAGAASALADLIRTEAGGRPVHAVGLSLGAQTLLHLLAHAPDLVDRVVLSGTLAHPLPGLKAYQCLMRLAFPLSRHEWMIRAQARQMGIPAAYYPQFRDDTLGATLEGLLAVVTENMTFRLPERLEQTASPILALVGDREIPALKRSAEELARRIPTASAYLVPNAGHVWCFDRPSLFAQVVAAFVTGQALPDRLIRLQ